LEKGVNPFLGVGNPKTKVIHQVSLRICKQPFRGLPLITRGKKLSQGYLSYKARKFYNAGNKDLTPGNFSRNLEHTNYFRERREIGPPRFL